MDPVVGHEQGGKRPFLVLSIGALNRSPLEMVVGLPVTTTNRGNQLHIRIEPAESGLPRVSYVMPEMVRSISTRRFRQRMGQVPIETVETAAAYAGFLVGLGQTRF
jgi:mRNA interferase MazF